MKTVTILWPRDVGMNPRLAVPAGRPWKRLPGAAVEATYTEQELWWALEILKAVDSYQLSVGSQESKR